jgi:hypothetical protein
MMDPAFFVGKNELLTWLNDLLEMNYSKVEQCANGAAYCQIMDAIYPVWIQACSYFSSPPRHSCLHFNSHDISFLLIQVFVFDLLTFLSNP